MRDHYQDFRAYIYHVDCSQSMRSYVIAIIFSRSSPVQPSMMGRVPRGGHIQDHFVIKLRFPPDGLSGLVGLLNDLRDNGM